MGERVRITDVSPRDGLQNEPGVIPTVDKVRLIELLSAVGFDELEITSFVSPKWVPQLADAGEVVGAIADFAEGVRSVTSVIPRPETRDQAGGLPMYSALVPNEKGFERALEAHENGFPLKVALFTAASETFSTKNTNASIEHSIARFAPIVPRALDAEMPIRAYISCAIACPFEGAIDPGAVRAVADRLLELAPAGARQSIDIDLGDTIGVAHPDDVAALLARFEDLLPQLTLHLHDTHGRAPACVKTALAMGVRSFDGSAAGLGGCPFASTPDRRAPGNIATETLVRTIHDAGFTTGADLEILAEGASFAREIVERARAEAETESRAGEDDER